MRTTKCRHVHRPFLPPCKGSGSILVLGHGTLEGGGLVRATHQPLSKLHMHMLYWSTQENRHEIGSKVTSVRLWQSVIRLGLTMVKALSVELEVSSL